MSARGIEIHNGYLDLPEGMPQTLHMGTDGTPLEQGVADQIIVSAVVNAVALGGAVKAGQFMVIASVSLTGNLESLMAQSIINDGITVTGTVFGARIKAQVLGAGVAAASFEGLRLELSSAAGASFNQGVYGIFISNYIPGTLVSPVYHMIRLQENGTVRLQSFLYCRAGGGGVDYAFVLHGGPPGDAWRSTESPTGAGGFIKVLVGGVPRWIQLYHTAPP
ncbi:hypothetical protein ES703_88759 [subsurface metagenome]